MSTDAENARIIINAAERIEQLMEASDAQRRADIANIRKAMHRAVHKPWTQRLADWIWDR